MFIGRETELGTLERLYRHKGFRMAVVYGRRRVGKTALLSEFCRGKQALFFTAQQKNTTANLRVFSRQVYEFLGLPASTPPLPSWDEALSYFAQRLEESGQHVVFVFDEFPYAAEADPSLPSIMQIAIDHQFSKTNTCLILCGSNESFMEGKVLGSKSPLYGRRHVQIRLRPFNYYDAAQFVPGLSPEDRVTCYAAFGGTPYYLEQLDADMSLAENIEALFFDLSGTLYVEPQMLLRQELREPAVYASVLDAVGSGATVPKQIAERAGVDENAIGSYLAALVRLDILQRIVPFGENPSRSRKGRYSIKDPFFAFWYRFVSPSTGAIEQGLGRAVARQALEKSSLSEYVGHQFENVCMQWVVRRALSGLLPFLPTEFGRWWGTDPSLREQVDVDVVAASSAERRLLVGECKWRGSFNETEAVKTLERRACLLGDYDKVDHVLFMKGDPSPETARKAAERDDLEIVTAEDLYSG